jgi:MerR family transcriptional regulator, light-induced transcriptional regulator
MYTIKQAAARTGLAIPTIRAWERRYGVGTPTRTAAGYRLYGDETITRLRAMRHLVDVEGWRPSQAAEWVLSAGADLAAIGDADFANELSAGGDAPSPNSIGNATDAFVSAARRLDVQAMEQVLDEAFASQRFERAMDHVVFPALRAVGEAWASGEIDVAAEHASSETVRRRLARFFDATGGGEGRPRVLIGLPPAGHHELGAFAFAVACRRAGMDVLYLGANVPVESWLRTTRETGVEMIVLAIVIPDDVPNATAVIDALRATERPPVCLVGGPSSGAVAEDLGAIRLPDSIGAGVVALGELLGR